MSIRHPALATRRRIFRGDAKIKNVYDWVGSLSLEPMFLKIFCNNTDAIPPSDPALKYALTTLNMAEVDEPLYFEDNKEITVKGFQGADDQNVFSVNSRRLQEKKKLRLDYNIAPFTADRHNVFNYLMKIYEDERVTSAVFWLTLKERTPMVKESLGMYFQNFSNLHFILKVLIYLLVYLVPSARRSQLHLGRY